MLSRSCVSVTVILVFVSHGAISEDKRWVVKLLDWYGEQFDITEAVVYYNKSFKIILEDYNTSFVHCSKENDNSYIFNTSFNCDKEKTGKWITSITVANATIDMSTKWICKTKKNFTTPHGFTMTVYVKGLMNVSVGRSKYNATPTARGLTRQEYNDVGTYQYVVGESVDAMCEAQERGGEIHLVYYNANDTKLIETDRIASHYTVDFRKTLNIEDNESKIDCIYSNKKLIYTYRIIFQVLSTEFNDLFKITINGMNLVSTDRQSANKYLYRYFKDETLQVTCQITKSSVRNLTFSFAKASMNANIESVDTKPGKTIIKLDTDKVNKKHLYCRDSANTSTADIRFLIEPIEPRIEGLSGNDVVLRYRKSSTTWVLDYSCDVDQALKLTCVGGTWSTEDSRSGDRIFFFNSQENKTSITCEAKNEKTIVHINRKTRVLAPDFPVHSNYWLIGVAAGVSTVTIIIVCIVVCRTRSRNKGLRQDSAHLTQNQEVEIPSSPPQWDDRNLNNQGVMLNNCLYDVNNSQNSEDTVYHYPVPVLSSDYAEPVNSIKRARNTEKGYSNLAGSSAESSLLRRNELGTVHDSVINVKRTSEFVEPAYSVLHRS